MDLSSILAKLPESFPWRDRIQFFDIIDSTNNRAKALAAVGAPHGTLLIADRQTGGRGRQGRSFLSPASVGVYMSVLLRPDCAPPALMHLTCAAATAMCDAVEAVCGFRPGIKWTNDLVSGGRKLAGILTELQLSTQGRVDSAVIGIGVNCLQQPEDFPEEIRGMAGSLASVSGQEIDRSAVAAAMVAALYRMDAQLLGGREETLAQYRRDCITLGNPICVTDASGAVRYGTALDIDDSGALIIRFDTGETQTVAAGEVSVRGMYGYV